MKLSEAIRLGAMLKPQAVQVIDRSGGSCALGAAMDAIGKLKTFEAVNAVSPGQFAEEFVNDLRAAWPLIECRAAHPVTNKVLMVGVIVTRLNDVNHWTREAIADWVETIEAQQAEAAVDPVGELAQRDPTPRVEVLS